ncbi:MAG: thiamine-monophosphate kinase [Candidatus Thorarchaeota archaeon]|nr:thiamine-monophosphate kinase [Candidatus Thorarchaeota archaeon]
MKIGEVGERRLLSEIRSLVGMAHGARLGFDEDASDLAAVPELNAVLNVDTFVSSTDRLPGMTSAQVGRKTAVMVLSDLVAKGVRPAASMLSLCVPPDLDLSEALEFVRGYSQYGLKNGVTFIGGDTGSAPDTVLTGVAIGFCPPDRIVLRGGARPGDLIVVTDSFGLTSVAYRILLKGLDASPTLRDRALNAAYKPELHFGLVESLSRRELVTAAMDSSDGLGVTLNMMADQAGLSFSVNRLPISSGVQEFAAQHGLDLLELIMNGGEEFSVVMTIPSDKIESAVSVGRLNKASLMVIGQVSEGSGVRYVADGVETVIPARGYDNFREWS